MDLNGDGHVDILSGSYSRRGGGEMAGTFQVFYGRKDGSFGAVQVLNGSDGEPLIITPTRTDNPWIDRVCTRPFAADLNGDGKLDIVAGNFTGTFAFFAGEGEGRFAPKSSLLEADGQPMRVDGKSDPFLVDFDGDGLLDIVSGASGGGVFLFLNEGTSTGPKFGRRQTLLPAKDLRSLEKVIGDAHVTGPQGLTRVWVDDVDGDGKLDLLVGDSLTLNFPAEGIDEATAITRQKEWDAKMSQLLQWQSANGTGSADDQKKFNDGYRALNEERKTFIREQRTGFIWLLRQR